MFVVYKLDKYSVNIDMLYQRKQGFVTVRYLIWFYVNQLTFKKVYKTYIDFDYIMTSDRNNEHKREKNKYINILSDYISPILILFALPLLV